MSVGYSLVSAVIVYGLDTYDGGGGLTVFLFSGVCSLVIWFMSVRGRIHILCHKKSESYHNYTFSFIGVVISLISWPILNMGGSLITLLNTDLTDATTLMYSAYTNTFLGLSTAILSSMILVSNDSDSEKMKPKVYIECFVNGGIVIASFNDISLNPVSTMVVAMLATILTLVFDKYVFQKTEVRDEEDIKMIIFRYSKIIWRILLSFVGCCVAAIIVSEREGSTLELLTTNASLYSSKALFIILGWFITLLIGLVFGLICAILINISNSFNQKLDI